MQIGPFVLQFSESWAFSQDAKTLDKLNCANYKLSLPMEFLRLNVPYLELDVELAHYALFTATLANLITDYESKSLGPMYGLFRQKLMHVATSILPWAFKLRNSHDAISNMDGFAESDLAVLRLTQLTNSMPVFV
jgi:hypothetical protein